MATNTRTLNKVVGRTVTNMFRDHLTAFAQHLAESWGVTDNDKIIEAIESFSVKKVLPPPKKGRRKRPADAPQPSKTAYIIYSSEIRPKVAGEGSEKKTFTEIGRIIGQMWKDLPEKEKAKYEKRAKDDKERYESEMKAYDPDYKNKNLVKEKLTDEQKVRNGVADAKKQSKNSSDGSVYCYNVKSFRVVKYNANKPGDKVWDVDNFVCGSSQEDLDKWKKVTGAKAKKPANKKHEEEEEDDDPSDVEEHSTKKGKGKKK